MIMTWTEERIAELKRLHSAGYSFTDIAARIGVSRNSCIGKAHREQLFVEPKLKQAKQATERKPIIRIVRMNGNSDKMRVLQSVTSTPFEPRCVELAPRDLTLMELGRNDCRYIAGDDFLFCGHPKQDGSSFCPKHHRLCWRKPESAKPRYVREAA